MRNTRNIKAYPQIRALRGGTFICLMLGLLICFNTIAKAFTEDLQTKISEKGGEIELLEQEIASYQEQLTTIGAEKQTLESAVKTLDITAKKFSADIQLTQRKISGTERIIDELASNITTKGEQIKQNKEALAISIQSVREIDDTSLIEIILANEKLSDIWNTMESIRQFQNGVNQHVTVLKALRTDFENTNWPKLFSVRVDITKKSMLSKIS